MVDYKKNRKEAAPKQERKKPKIEEVLKGEIKKANLKFCRAEKIFEATQNKIIKFDEKLQRKIEEGQFDKGDAKIALDKILEKCDKKISELIDKSKKEMASKNPLVNIVWRMRVHDTKNVLTTLLSNVYTLNFETYGMPDKEEIKKITRYVPVDIKSRMKELSLDDFKKTFVNINEILNFLSTMEPIRSETRNKGVGLDNKLSGKIHLVNIYQDFTYEALKEIIRNAVLFTPKDGKITIETKENNGQVEIYISDTGCGISPENLKKIDENKEFTTRIGGTGKGLSLVKQYFTEMLPGQFEVKSELEKGTTIKITLPTSKE